MDPPLDAAVPLGRSRRGRYREGSSDDADDAACELASTTIPQTIAMNPAGIQMMTPAAPPTTIVLQVGPTTILGLTPESITLTVGSNGIAITKAGVFLVGGGASLALTMGNASLMAPTVRINS